MGFVATLIYIILSLSVGSLLVGISVNLNLIDTLYNYLGKNVLPDSYMRLSVATTGVLLILICFLYLKTIFNTSRKNKSIAFDSPQGNVSITLFAIEDMLKKMLEEKTEVSHIKAKVFLKKKYIQVDTKGVLNTEVNLIDFTKEIQEQVKEKMHVLLGEDKNVQVNLKIEKIALGSKKISTEENEPEVPFRNYE